MRLPLHASGLIIVIHLLSAGWALCLNYWGCLQSITKVWSWRMLGTGMRLVVSSVYCNEDRVQLKVSKMLTTAVFCLPVFYTPSVLWLYWSIFFRSASSVSKRSTSELNNTEQRYYTGTAMLAIIVTNSDFFYWFPVSRCFCLFIH